MPAGGAIRRAARVSGVVLGALVLTSCPCAGIYVPPVVVRIETFEHVAIADAEVTCESSSVETPTPLPPSGGLYWCRVAYPDEILVRATWHGATLERRVFVARLESNASCAFPDQRTVRFVFPAELAP